MHYDGGMIISLAIACLLSPLPPASTVTTGGTTRVDVKQDEAIAKALTSALAAPMEKGAVPGAIGAIVTLGQETRVGAIGLRKVGSNKPFLPTDLVHIGSDTKAMTGVLLGRLIDQGKLRWDSTVGEVLTSIADDLHEDFRAVTLAQLMHMTAGLPADPESWFDYRGKPVRKRRLQFAKDAMGKAPLTEPGKKHLYSNLSVMVACAMAEAVCNDDWENLMRKEVFGPLGMDSAGFGFPGKKKRVDQPWGHFTENGKLKPIQHDNDEAMGAAGIVHLSMEDWGKFVSLFLADDAEDDSDAFLKNATRKRLMTPDLDQYAIGWLVVDQPWSNGKALVHSGSNTYWLATAWVAPGRKTAFLVVTNAYNQEEEGKVNGLVNDCVLELISGEQGAWK